MLRKADPSFSHPLPPDDRPPAAVPPAEIQPRNSGTSTNLRWIRLAVVVAMLATALLAHFSGAPGYLSLSLLALGSVAAIVWIGLFRRDIANERRRREAETANRRELESLADRVWELQESEERFRGLIDALGDIVVHRDRQGRIVYANRVLADLVGMEQHALTGRTLSEIGIDVGVVPDADFVEREHLTSTDVVIGTPSGDRWFSWIELSARDESNNAVSHRAVAREITARKRAEAAWIGARERAENASKAKSRFLATVSHEIRTPMNGILGMANLLEDTRLSPEQQTYVAAITTSASALLALIEDLLDFSKIEFGRFTLEEQPVRIRELVENVTELLAARAHAKGIGIGSFVSPDLPDIVQADHGRLRQVLLNLMGNAIKFTDEGGVLVSLEMESADRSSMVLSVKDTGPGIAQKDIDRIFLDFEQADGSSTRRHGGAGLGLSISKRIIDAMGGTIAVESEPGRGSTFRIELPLVSEDAPSAVLHAPLAGKSVLVVLAARLEAESIAMTIRANGGHAATLAAPSEAAQVAGRSFDAVLVDAGLEDGSGGFLQGLRDRGIGIGRAVCLVAQSERDRLPQLRASGYGTFLIRPVRAETLMRVLLEDVPDLPDGAEDMEQPDVAGKAASRAAILIAEDNPINALLAKSALVREGYGVEIATTGRAAVDAVVQGAGRFGLVLMDLHMPVMDGLDAITELRRHEFENGLPPVPVIVLSADGQEETRQFVLAHGASDFLLKPLDPSLLARTVSRHMT